jgi:hypothetical protein
LRRDRADLNRDRIDIIRDRQDLSQDERRQRDRDDFRRYYFYQNPSRVR